MEWPRLAVFDKNYKHRLVVIDWPLGLRSETLDNTAQASFSRNNIKCEWKLWLIFFDARKLADISKWSIYQDFNLIRDSLSGEKLNIA